MKNVCKQESVSWSMTDYFTFQPFLRMLALNTGDEFVI